MSVPFSNTHLRVPRGFGTILEGLAREVLRDQPEDIPAFAAKYFEALLKQREGNCNFLHDEQDKRRSLLSDMCVPLLSL